LCTYSRISQHFMDPNVYYSVHKSPPLICILSQISPIHNIPSYNPKIHFNIVHANPSWSSSWSLSLGLYHQYLIWIPLLLFMLHALSIILFDLNILILLGEDYKFLSSSLCSFLQPNVTSSLFGQNIPPQHPVLKHPQSVFLP
jgi:hypothetical protein